jgi:hypothetical protein
MKAKATIMVLCALSPFGMSGCLYYDDDVYGTSSYTYQPPVAEVDLLGDYYERQERTERSSERTSRAVCKTNPSFPLC